MKIFVLYTLARFVLFGAVFGLIWLIGGPWMNWNPFTLFVSALGAMVVSSIIALLTLRGMRDRLATHIDQRARRAKSAFEAHKAVEDADDPG